MVGNQNVSMPEEFWEWLRLRKELTGVPISTTIKVAVAKFMKDHPLDEEELKRYACEDSTVTTESPEPEPKPRTRRINVRRQNK